MNNLNITIYTQGLITPTRDVIH